MKACRNRWMWRGCLGKWLYDADHAGEALAKTSVRAKRVKLRDHTGFIEPKETSCSKYKALGCFLHEGRLKPLRHASSFHLAT